MNKPLRRIPHIENTAALHRVLCHPLLPFVVLFAVLLGAHLTFIMIGGDEEYFGSIIRDSNLWDFSVLHYRTWSGRQLLELFECIFGYWPKLVWRIVNPFVAVGLALCLSYAVGALDNAGANWVLCSLLILYPWEDLKDAGWISTTLVYLWPAAFGMAALLPAVQLLRGKTPPWWLWAVSVPLLLYAANMEQTLLFLICTLTSCIVWFLIKRVRVHPMLPVQLCLCLLGALYAATCPGNAARAVNESVSYFKNYPMLPLVSKLELGASLTLESVFYKREYVFFFFTLLLCIAVWYQSRNWIYRLLGAWPLAVCAVCGTFQKVFLPLFPQLSFFTDSYTGQGIINLSNCNILDAYLPLLLLYGTFIVCLADLYLAFGHTPRALGSILAFFFAFGTRVAIGFSPTVGISGGRTGLFFSLCALTLAAALYMQLPQRAKIKWIFRPLLLGFVLLQTYSLYEM
ncbi:MAG: DUF6056 family protein [Ruthenibacterium sp.]